jgi:predicted nucleotidyltransferase
MLPERDSRLVRAAVAAIEASEPLAERELQGLWIFGSRARGTATPDSDLDLALLTRPPLGLERARLMELAARAAGCEVDVVDLASAAPALAWEVLTSGRLLIERNEPAVMEFLRRARFAAEDAAQRDRMVLLAQVGQVGGRTR